MLGKNEIVYYLIEHPFKEEKVIVFDRDRILETLNQFKEGMNFKRTLRVPQKEDGQKNKMLVVDKSLVKDYEKSSERRINWIILSTFGGLILCYLFFKPLFQIGYLPLINFLIRNFKTITPDIVNTYVDLGAQLAAIAIGMILGFSPLILSGVLSCSALKKVRKDKNHAELVRDLEKCQFEIVENESLASFYEDSTNLIGETRKKAEDLRKNENGYEKMKTCKGIRDHLEKIIIITKLHKLHDINEHYHRLQDSFYNLESRLKNPRFWRNDKKYIKELLGDLK